MSLLSGLTSIVLPPWISVPLNLARKVPWKVWAAIGAAIAFYAWLTWHDHKLEQKTEARVNATWEKAQKDAADKQAAEVNRLRAEIADWVLKYIAERDELAGMLREEGEKSRAAFDALAKERSKRVTPQAIARCDLTRGVILQFNAGAAAANGEPDPSGDPDASAVSNDASSAVPLDRLTAAIELTQANLGICREQVRGWNLYCGPGGVVDKWYQGIREKVDKCFPKGASP